MKIHDISAKHIFPNKPYTTYECIPELAVTVAAAHRTAVKKINPVVYLHIFHNSLSNVTSFTEASQNCQQDDITRTEFFSAVVKIP